MSILTTHEETSFGGDISDITKTIINALGEPADRIVEANKEEIARREKKISELQENRKTATEAQKENIDHNINEQQEQIDELERENEEIEERMPLRDKIKAIFKKHGLTITAVISAVTVAISVLVSNLKKGLTTLGKKNWWRFERCWQKTRKNTIRFSRCYRFIYIQDSW